MRSNLTDWSPEDLWGAYMQLTEAEAAFRIQKSDLNIRATWRRRPERVQAHLLVCFLAYVLWTTLARLCGRAGPGDEPRQIFEALPEVAVANLVLSHAERRRLPKRFVTQPTEHQQILVQRVRLKLPAALEPAPM